MMVDTSSGHRSAADTRASKDTIARRGAAPVRVFGEGRGTFAEHAVAPAQQLAALPRTE